MARITIDGLQSLSNFMGVRTLHPEKFDDPSLFDFVHIDIIHAWNANKCPTLAETSSLSSMT
jgi:hypothetical protein